MNYSLPSHRVGQKAGERGGDRKGSTISEKRPPPSSDGCMALLLRSVSRRRSRLHQCTPCRSIPSASPCRRQAKIERAQIVLDRSYGPVTTVCTTDL